MSKEAMKQMVKALEDCNRSDMKIVEDAITAGRQAIAEAEKQEGQSNFCPQCEALARELKAAKQEQGEPVAWIHEDEQIGYRSLEWKKNALGYRGVWKKIPLYTTPQQRTWVGLTKQEYDDIYVSNKDNIYRAMMVVATYLKRKNND
jgi:bacterioferritin-associated ferredoxin